jgi:hypothetical protein
MKNVKLRKKLIIYFLAIGILPILLISGLSLKKSSESLESAAYNQLISIRYTRKVQIETFFETTLQKMHIFARSQDFTTLYARLKQYHIDTDTKPDGAYDVSTPEYADI